MEQDFQINKFIDKLDPSEQVYFKFSIIELTQAVQNLLAQADCRPGQFQGLLYTE